MMLSWTLRSLNICQISPALSFRPSQRPNRRFSRSLSASLEPTAACMLTNRALRAVRWRKKLLRLLNLRQIRPRKWLKKSLRMGKQSQTPRHSWTSRRKCRSLRRWAIRWTLKTLVRLNKLNRLRLMVRPSSPLRFKRPIYSPAQS